MIATLGRAAAIRLLLRATESGPAGERVGEARVILADRRLLSFVRGLSFGALVGAAIAGLGIWGRLKARAAHRPA